MCVVVKGRDVFSSYTVRSQSIMYWFPRQSDEHSVSSLKSPGPAIA